jgi:hypothetical protein
MGSGKEKNELKRGKIKDGNHTDIVFIDFLPLYGNGLMDAAASWTRGHSFKSPAIAAAIARYSLLRQGAAICVHVQFSRYIPL